MAWTSIGIKKPTLDWQLYDSPVVGTETFKISSTWSIPPFYKLRAYLGQFFDTDEVVIFGLIYPTKDNKRIVELKIPDAFQLKGLTTRYIGIKLGHISKPGLYPYDWEVNLHEFN